MFSFCGWIGNESEGVDDRRAVLRRMAERMPVPPGEETTFLAETACGVAASGRAMSVHRERGLIAVLGGRFRYADRTLETEARSRGPAAALVSGYGRFGDRVLDFLEGAFALAVLAEDGSEALLAVDRIGGRCPLRFRAQGGTLVFATNAAALLVHPAGAAEIDPQAIYDYLYFHVTPAPRSVHRGVRQLGPAELVRFREGESSVRPYWHARYRDDDRVRVQDLCDEFRGILRGSVERAASGRDVGCFLSGGTDSSTVAGILGEITGRPAKTYSIGFEAEGFDEMEYAREAVSRFGTEHHESYITPRDVVRIVPEVAGAYDEPFGNASAIPTHFCALMARRDGVDLLLGGDGGDEIFAGNQRYATQHVFELYKRVPEPLRAVLIEPVVMGLPGGDRLPPLRKIRSYIRQAKTPMPDRMETYNHLERAGVENVLARGFLDRVDPTEPHRLLAEVYHGAQAVTLLNRMLALDMKFTIADSDLPKVSRMCELAGLDVAYPFLDDEMVEFALRVPARLKLRGFKLRWFMKHALRDFLPEKILTKKKHGFGLPFGLWLRDDAGLRELARDSLHSIERRRLLRPGYVDDLLRRHDSEHATYYGVMIWVLMMLELWLRAHEPGWEAG